jgi:hypothetical protein
VGDHGLGGAGGVGFAASQTVTQISRQMLTEKRSARILCRPHAPFPPRPTASPNLPFQLFNDFVMIDRHGSRLYLKSQISNFKSVLRPSPLLFNDFVTVDRHGSRLYFKSQISNFKSALRPLSLVTFHLSRFFRPFGRSQTSKIRGLVRRDKPAGSRG